MAANIITDKTLYVGEHGGEILCEQCAGMTLKSSIKNAKSNQVKFTGLHGETFWLSSIEDLGLDCEGSCA